jgi:predicted nucleic acid-binding protein
MDAQQSRNETKKESQMDTQEQVEARRQLAVTRAFNDLIEVLECHGKDADEVTEIADAFERWLDKKS